MQDTGEGLPAEKIAQLFQPFNRLGQEASAEEGTGIGLVVSKRLIELMGGEIGVESIVGVGSVFWIELKLAAALNLAVDDDVPLAPVQRRIQHGTALRTLLYVEDNQANMQLVEQLIARRPDMRLLKAGNGTSGIALARIHQPEVILMDINLPGISGIQALKILREDPVTDHIPVLAISANAMPRDIEKGLEAGFFRYLTKPIKVNEFMMALDMALEFAEKELIRRKKFFPVMISTAEILNASILIVDDQQANVLLLENMLREAGYQRMTSTMDPLSVCALHRDNHYDLILLDLQMPVMDGFQVMEELKKIETNSYVPILVITALPNLKLRALASGAKDFISKPFDLVEVMTRIHNMLEVRLLYNQLEHSNKVLETLSMHDELTGLPNRRLLMDRLSLAIAHAHRSKLTMAVLYLDLDGFKQINDILGHDVGDTLLKMIAIRLLGAVRQEDTVARIGGDEFVIALPEIMEGEDVEKLVSKVLQAASQPYTIKGSDANITVSIGVSIFPTHGVDAYALMKNADLALYEAKHSGKNDYRIAEEHRKS